ncbi:ABC transporter permease [Hydrogenimonas thermophila]|uniref:ABC-2 type transport system permease protein n=1 Tax=Hydrogenimonas thermophila TaxID=223786 RepID=A0A1I5SC49_9BACT|nr:ABC transporter permease [Hydrogenimonas thermophila]WOE70788.1 ABC transporter permease [Hydrogenimonas thermophila]WOE73306.1 ABC transporter permease [Hydrogenimonas thermophila]SFP67896.1 ABC-2 type transport system permease protein [Hydrogenimonas thermophila]
MSRIFLTILNKEFLSFLRSIGLVIVVLYSFTEDIYISGAGIQIKPRNVKIGYVDNTGGGISQKLLSHLHPPEFMPPKRFKSQRELNRAIFNKEIIVGLIFDEEFEKDYRQGKKAQLNLLLDSTAASQAFTTLSYLQNIVLDFSNLNLPIEIKSHKLFNQNSDNHSFMALTEMLSVITLLIVILTATVFVKEKEDGTWDIMLLMPVDPKLIIIAKSFSQILIVIAGVVLSLGFVVLTIFDTPINGSFWAFILLTFLYLFSGAGIGLFVAAVSRNVMQVAQLSIVIMMPLIFLSGAWTPIYAMHPILQALSVFSPLRYYIEGTESIFFRGTNFFDLYPYFIGVLILGIIFYWYGFRKIGRLF